MAYRFKEDRKDSQNKTVRFPLELNNKIKRIAKDQNISFSAFVIQACRYALDNLEEDEDNSKEK